MDKVRKIIRLVFSGRLSVQGKDRTFVRVPLWLAVVAALASLRFAVITAVAVVGFGMTVSVEGR